MGGHFPMTGTGTGIARVLTTDSFCVVKSAQGLFSRFAGYFSTIWIKVQNLRHMSGHDQQAIVVVRFIASVGTPFVEIVWIAIAV